MSITVQFGGNHDNCLGNQKKNCEIKITGKLFIVEIDDSLAYLYLTHIIVGKNTVKVFKIEDRMWLNIIKGN